MLAKRSADAGLALVVKETRQRYGFDSVLKELLGTASPEERARVSGMLRDEMLVAAGLADRPRRLTSPDIAELQSFLSANPWIPDRSNSPSSFITNTLKKWLDRGLALADLRLAQRNLASAYSAEISYDPSKRVTQLYVKPHRLPPGMPLSRRKADLTVAELSEEELAQRRERERQNKARQRAKPTSTPFR